MVGQVRHLRARAPPPWFLCPILVLALLLCDAHGARVLGAAPVKLWRSGAVPAQSHDGLLGALADSNGKGYARGLRDGAVGLASALGRGGGGGAPQDWAGDPGEHDFAAGLERHIDEGLADGNFEHAVDGDLGDTDYEHMLSDTDQVGPLPRGAEHCGSCARPTRLSGATGRRLAH
jgi:hypothetical protein